MQTTKKADVLSVTVEGAIITALAMALNYLPHTTGISAVEFSYGLVPLTIYAFRRGFLPATLSGFVWGILDLILRGLGNGSVLNPLQGFLEYFIAFALVGLAGLGYKTVQARIHAGKSILAPALGYATLGIFGKYLIHFIAGGYYWGMYAPKGMNPWIYSLTVNGGSALANVVLVLVVLVLLKPSMKTLLIPKR
ncbi:energy-coupled thiamine transporter ThiT [Lactobacillus sp. YT155]|uniref:energy-coupled thiamine transporter ThiT n=1 Tax=Lactobacillus sp. YT155 TaxID=3060955 RepID=UPI00265D64C1|nr:energy-coupled thiamine transporter ThiT [Lactobacillus sp. YT155]MDO1605260.1 energy-coupled thiamine transporter ThiT [Lactobacillus sp. YT155]